MKEYKDLTEAFSEFKKNAIEHGQHTMSGDHKLGKSSIEVQKSEGFQT